MRMAAVMLLIASAACFAIGGALAWQGSRTIAAGGVAIMVNSVVCAWMSVRIIRKRDII